MMTGTASTSIDDIAAGWAARALSGNISDDERQRLESWLASNAANRGAFETYMAIAEAGASAGDAASENALLRDLESFADEKAARRVWLWAAPAMAASIAGAAVFFAVMSRVEPEPTRYATDTGERAEFILADGSQLSMNTATTALVLVTDETRNVELLRGEAFFDVVRDETRPFVVQASNAEVRVLGTSFNVKALKNSTAVSVLSGVVEVASGAGESFAGAVTLTAGQGATINPAGRRVEAIDIDKISAWRNGESFYENMPLREVIADLNRYFDTEIRISDSRIEAIPVTGGFDLTDQNAAVEGLAVALDLSVDRAINGDFVLRSN